MYCILISLFILCYYYVVFARGFGGMLPEKICKKWCILVYICSGESRGGPGPPPPRNAWCSKLELFSKIYKKNVI